MARSINYQILCTVHRVCDSIAKWLITRTVYLDLKNEILGVENSLRISPPKEDKCGAVLQECCWNYWLPFGILGYCK
jgi:hypothetical protein